MDKALHSLIAQELSDDLFGLINKEEEACEAHSQKGTVLHGCHLSLLPACSSMTHVHMSHVYDSLRHPLATIQTLHILMDRR